MRKGKNENSKKKKGDITEMQERTERYARAMASLSEREHKILITETFSQNTDQITSLSEEEEQNLPEEKRQQTRE